MVYRRVQSETSPAHTDVERAAYRVYEGEDLAAEFGYHTERRQPEEICRFWIDGIRLCEDYADGPTMEAVLQFIQYKCQTADCPAMHVRLDMKNLFYLEQYQKYGFYLIDREDVDEPHGEVSCESVLKYPMPHSKDEVFRSYIMRSERKRAKKQPG